MKVVVELVVLGLLAIVVLVVVVVAAAAAAVATLAPVPLKKTNHYRPTTATHP